MTTNGDEEVKTFKHGGYRAGSGRKKGVEKISVGIHLTPDTAARLREEGNISGLIETLLCKYFKAQGR